MEDPIHAPKVETRNLKINLDAPVAHLNATLQRMLSVLRVLEAGSQSVTTEQIAATAHFMSFHPAAGHTLPLDEARKVAMSWLNNAFLRDAIEAAGLFVDEYLIICALLNVSSPITFGKFKAEHRRVSEEAQRLHFPQKIEKLNNALGTTPQFTDHVLSLNRARTCLVHRLGRVSARDTNQGDSLVVQFRSMQLVAVEDESGKEKVIDKPNTLIEANSKVEIRLNDYQRTFALGDTIDLTSHDLYSVIMTLWAYAATCQAATTAFARQRNIPIDTPTPPHPNAEDIGSE